MKKPYFEVKETLVETVEDLIKILLEVPKDYKLNPMGERRAIGIDHYHGAIRLDDPYWMEDIESFLKEEIEENGKVDEEPKEEKNEDGYLIDVPDEDLVTYHPELYVLVGYSDVNEKDNYQSQIMGIFSTEELAKEYGEKLVKTKPVAYFKIESFKLDELSLR